MKMKKLMQLWRAAALASVALYGLTLGAAPTDAQMEHRVYEVTITNLTAGQLLSPPVLATHGSDYSVFEVGEGVRGHLGRLPSRGTR